ncbi:MAG: hypothetical protein ABI171_18520 [Collimonas sp.]|uniref:hypothetical protein n=1 Tax=Collimonas sp. TaxID=1963772 RepID=UPI0032678775
MQQLPLKTMTPLKPALPPRQPEEIMKKATIILAAAIRLEKAGYTADSKLRCKCTFSLCTKRALPVHSGKEQLG